MFASEQSCQACLSPFACDKPFIDFGFNEHRWTENGCFVFYIYNQFIRAFHTRNDFS